MWLLHDIINRSWPFTGLCKEIGTLRDRRGGVRVERHLDFRYLPASGLYQQASTHAVISLSPLIRLCLHYFFLINSSVFCSYFTVGSLFFLLCVPFWHFQVKCTNSFSSNLSEGSKYHDQTLYNYNSCFITSYIKEMIAWGMIQRWKMMSVSWI